jgi:hypothetical protein
MILPYGANLGRMKFSGRSWEEGLSLPHLARKETSLAPLELPGTHV